MQPAVRFFLSIAAALLGGTVPAHAQSGFEPPTPLVNPTSEYSSYFASSIAGVGEDRVLVGTRTTGVIEGVYLLDADTGRVLMDFKSPDLSAGFFGVSVTAVPNGSGGHNLVVGAPGYTVKIRKRLQYHGTGAAYVFDGETGEHLHTLLGPSPHNYKYLGGAVAAAGDDILVGGWNSDEAYLFDGSTGALLATYENPVPDITSGFGETLAASGDLVLIGADGYDEVGAEGVGIAYLFNLDAGDLFGRSVSFLAGKALIGEPGDDTLGDAAGAAHLFDLETGEVQTLLSDAPDPAGDAFGSSIAVSGTRALIGARWDDRIGPAEHGAVLVFDATGVLVDVLTPPTPEDWGLFGRAVAGLGGDALVGAPYEDSAGVNTGAAYRFALDGVGEWRYPAPPHPDAWFGNDIASAEDRLLVGVPDEDDVDWRAAGAGAAYLYDGSGALLYTLRHPVPKNGAGLGHAVALVGPDKVVAAAPWDDTMGFGGGALYYFDGASGAYIDTLFAPDPGEHDRLGWSLAAVGTTGVVAGAIFDDATGTSAGAVHHYDLTSTPPTFVRTIGNPSGGSGEYFGYTIAVLGEDRLLVGAEEASGTPTPSGKKKPKKGNTPPAVGAAYLFDLATGDLLYTFLSPEPDSGDCFGSTVAAVGTDRVMIAATGEDTAAPDAGAVYLFQDDGTLLYKLYSPDALEREDFGSDLAAIPDGTGDWDLLIADRLGSSDFQHSGAAYLFDGATGELLETFANPEAEAWDYFSQAVVPFGTGVAISAHSDSSFGIDAGAVWLYERSAP
ncbi:MAG: hypothetical protein JRI25_19045 [Deltaproteobacteria bacterium]|nr:hypothetical protein [Deltaproteobacteria bacterium]